MIGTLQTLTALHHGTDVFSDGTTVWGASVKDPRILISSTDLITWTELYTFTDPITSIHKMASGALLVGTDNNSAFGAPDGEIYRSSDGGATFSLVLTFFQGTPIHWSIDSTGTTAYAATYGEYGANKLYKTTDDGVNWSETYTHSRSENIHFHQVYIDKQNTTHVYLAVGDITIDGHRTVYKSTDSGANFDVHHEWFITAILDDDDYLYYGGESPHKNHTMAIFRESRATGLIEISRNDKEVGKLYRGWVSGFKKGVSGEIYAATTSSIPYSGTDGARGYVAQSWDHGTTWEDIFGFDLTDSSGRNRIKQIALGPSGKVIMLAEGANIKSYIYTPDTVNNTLVDGSDMNLDSFATLAECTVTFN